MNGIFSLDVYYLISFFVAVFAASFAIPTGAVILIVSFASVAESWIDLSTLIFLSLVATISGDYFAYLMTRHFRKKINAMILNGNRLRNKMEKAEKLFDKYGVHTVFLTRFLFSGIGPYVNFFSGLRNMPQRVFLKAIISGEIIYCFAYLFIGYFFRATWQESVLVIRDYTVFIAISAAGIFVIYRLIKLVLKSNKISEKTALSND